jgi:asparagine synthase (glutamine-hydrolysing)
MCGIAGFAGAERPGLAEAKVRAMLSALTRRGPDGEGVETWEGVCLGHRRLAILDLSDAGHQPMLTEDREVGLVFNGCIYNFLELRRELESLGHRFHSQCDTEVILRGYRQWGIAALVPRLRGMFAFAIRDRSRGSVFLVRDRLGVKPLIYWMGNGQIAFASTVEALQAAGCRGDIRPTAVLEFLEFGFVTDAGCIFEGFRKLPPATILEWRDGGNIHEARYWEPPRIVETSSVTFEEAVEETERLFLESVRLRLCSDVPIGALLSGGVDSSLVCWALAKLNANIKAFTVGAPGDPSDESAAAAQTARALGIPHEIVRLGDNQPMPLDELSAAYSEPFASQSAVGMLRVSRAVKERATVLLTGDGGDDVYFGYSFFQNALRAQNLARNLPSFFPKAWRLARPFSRSLTALRSAGNFLDYTAGGIGPHARVRDSLTWLERNDIPGERLRGHALAQRCIPASRESAKNLLEELFRYHFKTHFLSEFMPKVDGSTMFCSVEARSPFLDHKLWDFAAALPPAVRFQNGQLKSVLREIAVRRLGREVAFRGKQGFTVPVEKWIAGDWRKHLDLLRSDTLLARDGWISQPQLTREIENAIAAGRAPVPLWYLMVLEKWLHKQKSAPLAPSATIAGDAG